MQHSATLVKDDLPSCPNHFLNELFGAISFCHRSIFTLSLLKADVTDLASCDSCYVPPASPVWEPINIAASQIDKKL
jgi:hypothetical protein